MTKKEFLYELENAWLIDCERDENNNIDIEETIRSDDFKRWCWSYRGERLSCKAIYDIIEDLWWFLDSNND